MTGARVLLVVHDPAERAAHRALFDGGGLDVAEADSGAAALAFLAGERADLVVLSPRLPDGDGLDLLPRLKSAEFLPVIVSGAPERVRALQLGADDVVSFPCDPAELLARARSLLRLKETHDGLRRLQSSLEQMIVSDPLTGLHNRRFLMDRLAQEMLRTDRHGEPLALAMLDLDAFKPLNDEHGHLLGDQVLRAVGNAIARCVRVTDIAARYGGDEFAIILPQTPAHGAMRVCERILAAVGAVSVDTGGTAPIRITASMGLAYYPAEENETPEDLIHTADGALRGAKRSGKNRFHTPRFVPPPATA